MFLGFVLFTKGLSLQLPFSLTAPSEKQSQTLPGSTPRPSAVFQPQRRYSLPIFKLEADQTSCVALNVQDLAISPDNQRLAVSAHGYVQSLCGGAPSNLTLWNLTTGEPIATLMTGGVAEILGNYDTDPDLNALGGDLANAIAFTPDGQTLIAGMANGSVRLWRSETGQRLKTVFGHIQAIDAIAVSPDGQFFYTGSADGTVRVWSMETVETLTVLEETQPIRHLVLSPDGASIATILAPDSLSDTLVHLWHKTDDQWQRVPWEQQFSLEIPGPVFRTWNHFEIASIVQFGLGGKVLLTGSEDGVIRMWDTSRGIRVRSLQSHHDRIQTLAVTPEGQFLASQSDQGEIKFWNLATGQLIRTLVDAGGMTKFSQDGQLLYIQTDSGTQFWNWRLPQPQVVQTLPMFALGISPDHQTLITVDEGYSLGIWR
jgi:WD40 repeat protein